MNKVLFFILICLSCLGKNQFDKKIIDLSKKEIQDYTVLKECSVEELSYIIGSNKTIDIKKFYYYVFNEEPSDLYINVFKKLPNSKKIDVLFYLYKNDGVLLDISSYSININGVNTEGKTLVDLILEDSDDYNNSSIIFTIKNFLENGLKVEEKNRLKLIRKLFSSEETEILFEVLDKLKFTSKDVKDIEKLSISLLIEKVKNSYGDSKIEILKYLLDKGSDINFKDKDGYTALFYSQDENTIKFLLKNGASLKIKYKMDSSEPKEEREIFYSNASPFTIITILNNLTKEQEESVDYLKLYKYITEDMEVNLNENDKSILKKVLVNKIQIKDKKTTYNLLMLASKKDDIEIFEKIFGGNIKFTLKEINELLDISGEYKSGYVVAFLIKNGGDLESFNRKYSNFYFDVWEKDYDLEDVEDVFKTLIKAGIDFKDDREDYYKNNLLTYGVRRNNQKVIELLLDNGMNPNIKTEKGETPIMVALKYYDEEYVEIIDKLLEKGANISDETDDGEMALHLIVEYSPYEYKCKRLLEILEKYNIDFKIKDSNGDGLLNYLSSKGYVNLLKKYVGKGLNPNERNIDNLRPIDYSYGKETYDYLLSVTNNVNLKNEEGRESLKNSILKSDYEMFNYFLEKGVKVETGDLDYLLSRIDTEDRRYFYNKYIVKKLLEKADTIENQDKLMALAIKNNDSETIENLSGRGVETDEYDSYSEHLF